MLIFSFVFFSVCEVHDTEKMTYNLSARLCAVKAAILLSVLSRMFGYAWGDFTSRSKKADGLSSMAFEPLSAVEVF